MEDKSKEFYRDQYHLQVALSDINYLTYGYIASLDPAAVFEFGCNAGRHLHYLKNLLNCGVFGIDVNQNAVNAGNKLHLLDNEVGDENTLSEIRSGIYDVVLTNSVLCHIPDIENIMIQLKRIAKKAVICVESQHMLGDHWYNHDYESFGFESKFTRHAPAVGTVYELLVCVV